MANWRAYTDLGTMGPVYVNLERAVSILSSPGGGAIITFEGGHAVVVKNEFVEVARHATGMGG